ncbi:DUF1501 domain-containing protein [Acetobacteraceae bacterium KSS8]|uniref:DUF1501 domain-containing protein n=1 Tax=Endosaccharibacter trunci TaxID=2812733 RepID=A0ABT1W1Z1_9PROT|nr:DUF1501 domain-containing protein [Acetobacteraceae bacterium KSS8]
MMLSRRAALLGLGAAWSLGSASLALADPVRTPGDRRFVVVMLRGAMDGMSAVVPYGDATLAKWRAPLLPAAIGQPDGMLDLGGFFGLHPALSGLHTLYAAGEMLPVHAVAGGYRSRSHFEAQDYMESGADHRLTSGWLNRVVGALPRDPSQPEGNGLSVGLSTPLILRGPAPVGAYAPEASQAPSPDLYSRIAALNADDKLTGPAIARGLAAKSFATGTLSGDGGETKGKGGSGGFPALAEAAGHLLASADGPRIAALEIGGWDTHAGQKQRLNGPLRQLDAGLMALRTGLGPTWRDTAVLVMTEFGRTVRVNGTGGTDHGTATVAFLLGGSVSGGRVGGVWPGLAQTALFENRDLAPTTDIRALAKGVLHAHLGLRSDQLETVFPGSRGVGPMGRLIRA